MVQYSTDKRGLWALGLRAEVVRLYHYRALIQVLVERELKARYRGAALGFLW